MRINHNIYDIWSNIHFRVIGSIVYNYDDEYILNGAGQAQRWSDNHDCKTLKQILDDYESGLKKGSEHDDPKDKFYIIEGIRLYNNTNSITAEQLLKIAVKPVINYKNLKDVEYE